MSRTHEQPSAEPTSDGHVKVLADLCRARPAVFAALVRLSDHLQRQGLDREAATADALRRFGLLVSEDPRPPEARQP